jgi:TRAP-type mannitol/chloroaromatic compound transport system permease small subunit
LRPLPVRNGEAGVMPEAIKTYVRIVDAFNRRVGRIVMYGVFVMMGILLYSSISKTLFLPAHWTLEMAQFVMAGYYLLGGAYSLQLDSHVRMDLLYGRWSPRSKAIVDVVTIFMLFVYLYFLLYGGISSTTYALKFGETSYSSWSPYMAPVKIVMVIGIALTFLQATSIFLKDLAIALGRPLA